MNFLNPWFVLGGLATAVPVLLHLVRRDQARRVEFPSLMFLRKVSWRTIRFQRLRHLLLLIARILVLALLALAFMRPYRTSPEAAAAVSGDAARVILLDQSMSMAYGDRWRRAREAASRIARDARAEDLLALVTFSDQTIVWVPPTLEHGRVLGMLETLAAPTDRPTRYAQAIRAAEQAALESGRARRIIHLVSDFQRAGSGEEEASLRLRPGTGLQAEDVGAGEYSNLAVTQVEARSPDAGGGNLLLQSSLVNFGARDRRNVHVAASLDGKTVGERRIDMQRGETQAMAFPVAPPPSGFHTFGVEVEDAELVRDNRRILVWDARRDTPVLAVEAPGRASSYYLARAVNPGMAARYKVQILPLAGLGARGFAGVPAVIWNDMPLEDRALSGTIEKFVSDGGGLLIVCSDDSWAESFNRTFGEWLPFAVGNARAGRSGPRSATGYSVMTALQGDHPIFQVFREPGSGTFSNARIYRHATVSLAAGAEALARFDNGWPALTACRHGKGRALLLAMPSDTRGSDLPLEPVFAPFWQEMLRFLDAASDHKQAYEVGESISPRDLLLQAAAPEGRIVESTDSALAVLDPEKRRLAFDPGRGSVTLETIGIHEIRSASRDMLIAVNAPVRESDLSRADPAELIAAWLPASQNSEGAPVAEETASEEERGLRQHLWAYLLAVAAALFAAEGILSGQFRTRHEGELDSSMGLRGGAAKGGVVPGVR